MMQSEFPILEFDQDKNPFIKPSNVIEQIDVPVSCVLCFFAEAIEKILAESSHKIVGNFRAESFDVPLYEIDYKGSRIALIQAGVGAPIAAAQLEELTAMGCKRFIACGMCGVLQKELAVGHLIIPTIAVRDEGTSYHYVEPSREIEADSHMVKLIEDTLTEQKVPYIKAKTWTTDAFYRETPQKVAQRKTEGCVTVEMETSAYIAVARYNKTPFGQILCAGDSLAGEVWDNRNYESREDLREFVLRLALSAAERHGS